MDYLKFEEKNMTRINEQTHELTDFEKNENPYYSFKPQKYEDNQKDAAAESVKRAEYENKLIGYALKNSAEFNLDVSKRAKLESMRGRNLAQMLLNNQRYRKDSDLMTKVKETVEKVEIEIQKPYAADVKKTPPKYLARNRALTLENTIIIYQDAIAACKNYLKGKNPGSSKGVERYNLVRDKMSQLLDELNSINFAKQMAFRGLIGNEPKTIRDLIVEATVYCENHGDVTKEQVQDYETREDRLKVYSDHFSGLQHSDIRDMNKDVKMFYDAIHMTFVPDALINQYGSNNKEKKAVKQLLIGLRDTLARFRDNTFASASFVVGDYVVNLFQKEDNTLDFGFTYRETYAGDTKVKFKTENLNITARQLAHQMGVNMIENEKVFGEDNTKKILRGMKNDPNMKFLDRNRSSELAKALLRTRLGVANTDMTNISDEFLIKLASDIESKAVSTEDAVKKIKNYEYIDRKGERTERKKEITEKESRIRELNIEAHYDNFGSIEEMDKHYRELEKQERKKKREEEKQRERLEKEKRKQAEEEQKNQARQEQPKEQKVQPQNQAQQEQPKEQQVQPQNQVHQEQPKEQVQPQNQIQVEQPKEQQVQPVNQVQVEQPKEQQVQPQNQIQDEQPKEQQVQPVNQVQNEQPKEQQVQPQNQIQQNQEQQNLNQQNQEQQNLNQAQQPQVQQAQPQDQVQVEFPAEVIEYELSLNKSYDDIYDENFKKEQEITKAYKDAVQKLEDDKKALEERIANYNKEAEKSRNERDAVSKKYLENKAKALENLENCIKTNVAFRIEEDLENNLETLKERYGNHKSELEKELAKRKADIEKQVREEYSDYEQELQNSINLLLDDYDQQAEKKLSALEEKYQCRQAAEELVKIEEAFREENLKYIGAINKNDADTERERSLIRKERDLLLKWKDYYKATASKNVSAPMGFTALDSLGNEQKEVPLNFGEWKIKRDQDRIEEEARIKAEEEKREYREKILNEYRELSGDIRELKENDFTKTTDIRVNGADTLDLLRLRQLHEKDGTLKELIDKSDVYDEVLDKKKQDKYENDKKNNETKLKASEDQLKKLTDEVENLEAQIIRIREDLDKNKEKADKATEDGNLKMPDISAEMFEKVGSAIAMFEEADKLDRQELENEIAKIDEKQKQLEGKDAAKNYKEHADKRKKELTDQYYERAELRKRAMSAWDEESNYNVREKLILTESLKFNISDVKARVEKGSLPENQGRAEIDKLWKEFAIDLEEANNSVKKNRSDKETKRLEDLSVLLGERLELEDALNLAVKNKASKTASISEVKKSIKETKLEITNLNDYITQLANTRKQRQERIKREEEENKKESLWGEEGDKLMEIITEVIYAQNTWDMDNEANPGMHLWNVLKKYSGRLIGYVTEPKKTKKIIADFVEKLPTQALDVEKDELIDQLSSWFDIITGMVDKEILKKRKEATKRNRQRQLRKEAKKAEIEERKRLRAEENKRREEEEAKEDKKALEEYTERNFGYMGELEEAVAVEEYLKDKEKKEKEKKEKEANKSVFSKMWNFAFAGNDEDEDDKPELDPRVAASPIAKLRIERDEARKKRLEEEAKQDKEWEKEIEDAGYDDQVKEDEWIFTDNKAFVLNVGMNKLFEEAEKDKDNEYVKKVADAQKNFEATVHRTLRGMQDLMMEYVEDNIGDQSQEIPIEKVDYYKEKNISAKERHERIEKGSEQLSNMINNAMTGEQGEGQFLRNVLSSYFAKSSVIDLRSMLASALRNMKPADIPEDATKEEKMKALSPFVGGMFKGAGPLLQKLLQGMPGSLIPEGLEDAFDDIKQNLADIPMPIVEAQLLSLIERSDGQIRKITITKSLGAASVGQAFLCKVYTRGKEIPEEVVIKLLRPDVRNRMLREKKIMEQCAKDAGKGMAKTYAGQMERYLEELDLTIEARNCELGKIYDSGNVTAMSVSRLANPTPNAMMVNRAEGDTVVGVLKKSKATRDELLGGFYKKDGNGRIMMKGDNPVLEIAPGTDIQSIKARLSEHLVVLQNQQELLCKMAQKWVTEAVFGEGYYHGDLHAGNIMLSDSHLTIIDFGNATKINEFQREKITLMLMAAAAGNGDGFMTGFEALLSEESKTLLSEKRKELQDIFNEVMKLGNYQSSAERIGAALVRAQKIGFELPPAIYGFQQCQLRVQNTINSFNNEIREVQNSIKLIESAQNATVFKIKQRFEQVASIDGVGSDNIRMTMLTDNDDDLAALITDTSTERREWVDDLFAGGFASINDFIKIEDEILFNTVLGDAGSIDMNYEQAAKRVMRRKEWYAPFEKFGLKMPEKKDAQKTKDDNNKILSALTVEQKKELLKDLRDSMRTLDVVGAIKELRKAQDEGKDKAEIERLTKAAVECIKRAKKNYHDIAYEVIDSALTYELNERLEDYELSEEDRQIPERVRQFEELKKNLTDEKEEKLKRKSAYIDITAIEKQTRDMLLNKKNIGQAERELKEIFNDPQYGRRAEVAFKAYRSYIVKDDEKKKNADEKKIVVEEQKKNVDEQKKTANEQKRIAYEKGQKENEEKRLLDNLMEAIRMPLLLATGKKGDAKKEMRADMSAPDNFVNVMSDVINEKWRQALKRVNIFKSVKYGINIQEDVEDRIFGTMDVIKMVIERIFG